MIPCELHMGEDYNNWRFNIYTKNRDDILEKLFKNNLFASKHYIPLSRIFSGFSTPVWDSLYPQILNLFNDFRYTEQQARKTASIVLEATQ